MALLQSNGTRFDFFQIAQAVTLCNKRYATNIAANEGLCLVMIVIAADPPSFVAL